MLLREPLHRADAPRAAPAAAAANGHANRNGACNGKAAAAPELDAAGANPDPAMLCSGSDAEKVRCPWPRFRAPALSGPTAAARCGGSARPAVRHAATRSPAPAVPCP